MKQAPMVFRGGEVIGRMTVVELRAAEAAGLVRAAGRTGDGRVTRYELTGVGRILLGNRLEAEQAGTTEQMSDFRR